ncbi:MAG: 2-isopropylmalate synthase, partial [Lachnospiraceae bacterium]|nr:2-isopropylmalate synthase [Lachnospiraceae bacterium]
SGLAGIAHWLNTYYKLKGEKQVQKTDDLVKDLKAWVDQEYADGRVTVMTDSEIVAQVNKVCLEKGYKIGV